MDCCSSAICSDCAAAISLPGLWRQGATRTTPDIEAHLLAVASFANVLPPDPATVAPPTDPSVPTDIFDSTAFLYTGGNPIQTGVAPGTIDATRAAVLRGTVHSRDGAALSGVTITILRHPEFGQTKSRADGAFDLAVNGGGLLTVRYQKSGYLPVQRPIAARWRDFAALPDVVMIPLDTAVTTIGLSGSPPLQVARGNPVSDADGARRATVMFPQGTTANLVMPNGATQPISTLNVRTTEYTVGASGPNAMPGALPPSSGYTYAVELSVDEAIGAGAASVQFSQPVPTYVENFLALPVGTLVPAGFYDHVTGQWVASNNGRVIKVISITGGFADLDLDGSNVAAGASALAALGITDAERQKLALLYTAGQTLWRVPVQHFSPWDFNFPYGPPPGAKPPAGSGPPAPGPQPNKPPKGGPDKDCGSIIGCEPQTLGEVVDVAGTQLKLHYQSDRVPGRRDANVLKIRLSGDTLPVGLQRIFLEIAIAGQTVKRDFAPQANLVDTFTWDGKDAYGRLAQGQQPVKVRIGYEYVAQYYTTKDAFADSFNRFGSPPVAVGGGGGGGGGGAVTFSRPPARATTPPLILWQDYEAAPLGHLNITGVGGWTLSVHHAYDVVGRTVYLGDGGQRNGIDGSALIITTVAGNGTASFTGDGGPATAAGLTGPQGVAAGPDSSLYIADTNRVRRVAVDGTITTVAGNGNFGSGGDGGPATQAAFAFLTAIAVGPDGSLYLADFNNARIRRVAPNGIITTFAGNGTYGYTGDGGPATQAEIESPQGVAVGPDGSVYFSDAQSQTVRRVATDGIITTVAGTGSFGFSGDGGPATLAPLSFPEGLAVASDGRLYIADRANVSVRRVGTDGIITTIAGTGAKGFTGDGGPAVQAAVSLVNDVAASPDGSVFISDFDNQRIRRIGPDGIMTTIAGTGNFGYSGDGGPAAKGRINGPQGVAVRSDGSIYVADTVNQRVRLIRPSIPGIFIGDTSVASEDGTEIYVFTDTGRHRRTLDALTGTVRFEFAYDNAGNLSTITDLDGKVITIQRDGSGNPTGILAPSGQTTTLAVDADGYLSSITNPASQATQLTYFTGTAAGLLQTFTDARSNVHHYLYDALGRLTRDENPAGGVKVLARTELGDNHYQVTVTTAAGLVNTHEIEELTTGDTRRTRTAPGGAITQWLIRADGSSKVTYPDGTIANLVEGPDPRFGMQSPFVQSIQVFTPGFVISTRSATRTVALSDPTNLLSLITQTDTFTINGQIYTSVYDAAARTVTTTTPGGRQSVMTRNASGRTVQEQGDVTFGMAPRQYSYDAQGRMTQAAQGAQSWTFGYDAQARLTSRTDSAGAAIVMAYDAAGRRTQVTLPGGRVYGFAYDADGNRTQVTMPSLGVHALDYTPVNLEGGYTPPGNNPYVVSRDTDGRVTQVALPTGRVESFSYDTGNRFTGIGYPEAAVVLSYQLGDFTSRVAGMVRTPGAGTAQSLAFVYDGALVTGMTLTGAAQGQYSYTYDSNFLLKSIALTSGVDNVTTQVTRDSDGLINGVGPFTISRAGPAGAPSQIGDGTLTLVQSYDTLGRVATRMHNVGAPQKFGMQLTYNNVGRITTKVETVAGVATTWDYAYDPVGQLSQVQRNGAVTEAYTYDPNRNRLSRQLNGNPAHTATYDAQDRLIQQNALVYSFNADGYLTQRGSDTFQFSTTGELMQAVVGGQTVTYAYDGLRRRVSRTQAGNTAQYLYGSPDNALQITHSRDPAGVLTSYFYDEGRRLFALQRGATRYYVATDQLGSPRVVTDTAGTLVKVVEYDSFGDIVSDTNPGFDLPIGFAGGLADGTTGLVRFGLRDYDPLAGRWTARDHAVFGGEQANLYAYASNNPLNLVDPVGFGSAGVGLCEGVCVGLKLGYVPGKGISACFEAGVGVGNSLEIEPFGTLDNTGMSTEAKAGVKVGIAEVELGVEIPADPCGNPLKVKPKAEACVGHICATTEDGNLKEKLGLNEEAKLENPFKGNGKIGVTGKLTGKICQQATW